MGRRCAVFIDAEPPSLTGGGIRSYLLHTATLLQNAGMDIRIYSQSPEAFSDFHCRPIQRKPWPPRPLRGWLYKHAYAQAVAFEQSLWLADTLLADHHEQMRYEFCDYDGLTFHALLRPPLKACLSVRVHTPLFLIPGSHNRGESVWPRRLLAWREKFCLSRTPKLSAPSPEFLAEKLPDLQRAITLFNPPPEMTAFSGKRTREPLRPDFLFLGRWEKRKGLLELLQAFASFQKHVPEARLTVIGESGKSDYAGQVSAFIGKGLPWLTVEPAYAGPKDELFSRFSVLLIPSLWENAPYVFYEALAHGILALGSATGDMGAAQKQTHQLNPQGGSPENWTAALLKLWEYRHLAVTWREKQIAWIRGRRKTTENDMIKYWTHWPI